MLDDVNNYSKNFDKLAYATVLRCQGYIFRDSETIYNLLGQICSIGFDPVRDVVPYTKILMLNIQGFIMEPFERLLMRQSIQCPAEHSHPYYRR